MAFLALLALLAPAAGDPRSADHGPEQGEFTYYVLALSWSPTYCAERGRKQGDRQCSHDRQYAFVLHGLWPQYERNWPSFCDGSGRSFVPESVLKSMLDIMPARGLAIRQYRKHGTCTGMSPRDYFKTARRLFEGIKIPQRFSAPNEFQTLSPGQIEAAFIAANDGLDANSIAVTCSGGRRLREVRICFSKDLRPRACGVNEDQDKLCRLSRVVLPPVRRSSPRGPAR